MEKRNKASQAAKPGTPSGGLIPPPLPKGPGARHDVVKRPPPHKAGRNS